MLSPAKINLGLKILYKRPDNYHEINSLFIKLNWGDFIEIEKNTSHDLKLISKNELIGSKFKLYEEVSENGDLSKNIIFKSYQFVKSINSDIPGVNIKLTKRIPPGGGLGGGSSNAASIIQYFIQNSYLQLSEELIQKASKVGADIPFFLKEGNYFISGIGEKMQEVKVGNGTGILAIPDISIDTKDSYIKLNKPLQKTYDLKEWKFLPVDLISNLENGNWLDLREHLTNDFEGIAFNEYPKLKRLKKDFFEVGCSFVSMTGTGSCIYGLVEEEKLESVYSKISTLYSDYTFIRFNF